jgi:hypothetical protein
VKQEDNTDEKKSRLGEKDQTAAILTSDSTQDIDAQVFWTANLHFRPCFRYRYQYCLNDRYIDTGTVPANSVLVDLDSVPCLVR